MEGLVAVLAQEVIQAQPQLLKHHAYMVSILKPLSQVHAVVEPLWIVGVQRVENLQLHPAGTQRSELLEPNESESDALP